jgi:hypothetical protein
MERPIWPWWLFGALLVTAAIAGLLKQNSGTQVPAVKAVSATDSAAIEHFMGFVSEYQAQGRVVNSAEEIQENERAQLHQFFAWQYAVLAYSRLSPAEKYLVGGTHQKLPVIYDPGFMQHFTILSEKTGDVWEKEYRESLKARGFIFP